MRTYGKILLVMQFLAMASVMGQNKVPLGRDGSVPLWLTNGPFEVETTGFGDLSDKPAIDEINLKAELNFPEINPYLKDGSSRWNYLSPDENGFLDIKDFYGWKSLKGAEKIWYEKIVYAYADIYSDKEQSALLHFGGNTVISIKLNGETVYSSLQTVNAKKDDFLKSVKLMKGENRLLVKAANSHRNHAVSFFIPTNYEWGFFLRLTGENNEGLSDLSLLKEKAQDKITFNIVPTYFYKKINGKLLQKYLVEITSGLDAAAEAELSFRYQNSNKTVHFQGVKPGLNEKEFYVPEPKMPEEVHAKLKMGDTSAEGNFAFSASPKYELYFMPSTHMDIGYTNPQPIVVERQLKTLDDVVDKSRQDKNFRWTIETMWLLENYRTSRSKDKFNSLIDLIKKGQVAVSPIYTNPFTGWISESELAESFRLAEEYKAKYGITFQAAIYNDVPGQSWALPEALKKAGVNILVDGINEIFSNYKYQKSLPKVFNWQGSNSDKVTLYLTEAYTEGIRYGLEQDTSVIENRIWHTINNLQERQYPFNKILVSGSFSDNSGIALNQYNNALKWNSTYEYPKFIVSTLNEFAESLKKEDLASLKTVRGDWTSDWDILNQGETKRMLEYRRVQNELPSAEVMASVSQMENPGTSSFAPEISSVYKDMLNYSGHGSGLEYGFGSKKENIITDRFRQESVESAFMKTEEVMERSLYRLTSKKESFDSHGVMVFNTLSWKRSMPVEIEFPETDLNNYSVIDLSGNTEVNSYREGNKLYFIAGDVPGIGYKQYELKSAPGIIKSETVKGNKIENSIYSITLKPAGLELLDKTSGKSLFREGEALQMMPVIKRVQLDSQFTLLTKGMHSERIDENPVYSELIASYDNDIFNQIKFRLWKDLNRIDITLTLDLNKLKDTGHAEEYGLPFVLGSKDSSVAFDCLGGLIKPDDRFHAVGHESYAVRRMIDISSEGEHYLISSPDCRIFTLDTIEGKNTLIANVINNFPKSWNRNEDNTGTVEYHFSIAKLNGSNDVNCFGYEACTLPVVRRSWYKKDEPVKQFIKFSNPAVKLISLRPVDGKDETYEMTLQNSSSESNQKTTISSDILFASSKVTEVNFMGQKTMDIPVVNNSINLELSPNSINKITVLKLHN